MRDAPADRQSGPGWPDPVLYPDIAAAGSLHHALQTAFDQAGHRLTALPERPPGWRYVGARVEDVQRTSSVIMGIQKRVFIAEFWSTRVCMARGSTDDLVAIAGALHLWHSGVRVRELNTAWPFVHFDGLAEAHERGEAAEYTWQEYHDNPRDAAHLARLHAFIALAIQEPRLRALLPFTSMGTLGFAQTPTGPNRETYPRVTPADENSYQVTGASGRDLGTADAAGALALVLAALPPTTIS